MSRKLMNELFGPIRETFVICNNGNTVVTIDMVNSDPFSSITLVKFDSYSDMFYFYRCYPFLLTYFPNQMFMVLVNVTILCRPTYYTSVERLITKPLDGNVFFNQGNKQR